MKMLASLQTMGPTMGSTLALAGVAYAGSLDLSLEQVLRDTAPDETVSALVYMADQIDPVAMTAEFDAERATRRERHEHVVRALQDIAAHTQVDLVNELGAIVPDGRVSSFEAYWIANVVRVEAVPETLRAIADRADVAWVFLDYAIESIRPVEDVPPGGPGGMGDGGPEIGIEAVRAPEVWAMGYTGEGILVATLDTGVDGNHPALASRWRGLDDRYADNPEWAWFDPETNTIFPRAFLSHGTHTMGTVVGGAPGDQVGVAPGAEWMHAAVIDRVNIKTTVAQAILAFQWMIDPDGDPETAWDVPQSCSNSWRLVTGHGYPPCDETFWTYLDACEAAGIVIIFSAGNEGSGGLGRPPDRATDDYRTFAVAAVDARNESWPIASFSSRGPTFCTPDGSPAIKPDIAAPGVQVRSSLPGGGYGNFNGTSMASPHINGVVALMLQANPNLTVNEVKQIIFDTAFDLGASGEDNSYGWGMIDAFEAVTMAIGMGGPGDVNGDGVIDFADLLLVLAAWGDCPAGCPEDLNDDGVVDLEDVLIVLANWTME